MKHPDEFDIPAPCGCTVTIDHTKGDRRVICDHGKAWRVRARQQPTAYDFDELVDW